MNYRQTPTHSYDVGTLGFASSSPAARAKQTEFRTWPPVRSDDSKYTFRIPSRGLKNIQFKTRFCQHDITPLNKKYK